MVASHDLVANLAVFFGHLLQDTRRCPDRFWMKVLVSCLRRWLLVRTSGKEQVGACLCFEMCARLDEPDGISSFLRTPGSCSN